MAFLVVVKEPGEPIEKGLLGGLGTKIRNAVAPKAAAPAPPKAPTAPVAVPSAPSLAGASASSPVPAAAPAVVASPSPAPPKPVFSGLAPHLVEQRPPVDRAVSGPTPPVAPGHTRLYRGVPTTYGGQLMSTDLSHAPLSPAGQARYKELDKLGFSGGTREERAERSALISHELAHRPTQSGQWMPSLGQARAQLDGAGALYHLDVPAARWGEVQSAHPGNRMDVAYRVPADLAYQQAREYVHPDDHGDPYNGPLRQHYGPHDATVHDRFDLTPAESPDALAAENDGKHPEVLPDNHVARPKAMGATIDALVRRMGPSPELTKLAQAYIPDTMQQHFRDAGWGPTREHHMVGTLLGDWGAHYTASGHGMALQHAVADEFGLPGAAKEHLAALQPGWAHIGLTRYQEHGPAYRKLVRAMYDETQHHFKQQGIKHVNLYRGMYFENPEKTPDVLKPGTSGVRPVSLQPMSSFTSDPETAKAFANSAGGTKSTRAMVGARVPVEHILSLPKTGFGVAEGSPLSGRLPAPEGSPAGTFGEERPQSEYLMLGGTQPMWTSSWDANTVPDRPAAALLHEASLAGQPVQKALPVPTMGQPANLDAELHNATWLRRKPQETAAPASQIPAGRPMVSSSEIRPTGPAGDPAHPGRFLRGEHVQRHAGFINWRESQRPDRGRPLPYDPGYQRDPDLTAEANAHPHHSYARAFGMAYHGPTGHVLPVWAGLDDERLALVAKRGLTPGDPFVRGGKPVDGVCVTTQLPSGSGDRFARLELHTGKTGDLTAFVAPDGEYESWERVLHTLHRQLPASQEEAVAQAARDLGYSTLSTLFEGRPGFIVLDPARLRLLTAIGPNGRPVDVELLDHRGKKTTQTLPRHQPEPVPGHGGWRPEEG